MRRKTREGTRYLSLLLVMPALPLRDGRTDADGGHADLAWYTDVTGTKRDGSNEDLRLYAQGKRRLVDFD